jgi:hypothetical protein
MDGLGIPKVLLRHLQAEQSAGTVREMLSRNSLPHLEAKVCRDSLTLCLCCFKICCFLLNLSIAGNGTALVSLPYSHMYLPFNVMYNISCFG